MHIRPASPDDLPRIVAIYNASVPTRLATADSEARTIADRRGWFESRRPDRPILVGELDGDVVAWLGFEDFYPRGGYAHTAEVGMYVAPESQGRGLGSELLAEALRLAPEIGIRTVIGYVFAHNAPSLKLLSGSGFRQWGHLPAVVELDGNEHDVVIMGRRLEADAGERRGREAEATLPEVWLRGLVPGIPEELQPVAHALLQAVEEVGRLTDDLPNDRLWSRPAGAASAGFHLQHLSGVLDRLFTYARGGDLSSDQRRALEREGTAPYPAVTARQLADDFRIRVDAALAELARVAPARLGDPRGVGRRRLPSTVRGLYVHAAEHTMRHLGALLVTVRVLGSLDSQRADE